MEYEPVDRVDHGDGHQEWRYEFTRHGLKCSVTVTAWPNGNWGWSSLIDSTDAGTKPMPELSEIERVSISLFRTGPSYLPPFLQIGGLFPDLSQVEALRRALEQIDQLYAEAEKE